jgi:hypothetical protein
MKVILDLTAEEVGYLAHTLRLKTDADYESDMSCDQFQFNLEIANKLATALGIHPIKYLMLTSPEEIEAWKADEAAYWSLFKSLEAESWHKD